MISSTASTEQDPRVQMSKPLLDEEFPVQSGVPAVASSAAASSVAADGTSLVSYNTGLNSYYKSQDLSSPPNTYYTPPINSNPNPNQSNPINPNSNLLYPPLPQYNSPNIPETNEYSVQSGNSSQRSRSVVNKNNRVTDTAEESDIEFGRYNCCRRCCDTVCPHCCIGGWCCCCIWSPAERKQCAVGLLYDPTYLLTYVVIVAISITLLVWDVAHKHFLDYVGGEPLWFEILDVLCVVLMVFDVCVQMFSQSVRRYWRNKSNIFDFIVVCICVVAIPIYWYVPESDFILTCILLIRFGAQLLRLVMIIKHHRQRRTVMRAANRDIVDFSKFEDSAQIRRAQGRTLSASGSSDGAGLPAAIIAPVGANNVGEAAQSGPIYFSPPDPYTDVQYSANDKDSRLAASNGRGRDTAVASLYGIDVRQSTASGKDVNGNVSYDVDI